MWRQRASVKLDVEKMRGSLNAREGASGNSQRGVRPHVVPIVFAIEDDVVCSGTDDAALLAVDL